MNNKSAMFDKAVKISTLITALLVPALFFALNAKYVMRSEHEEFKEEVRLSLQKLTTAVTILVEQGKVNNRQDEVIRDHELRIRELEKTK